ncbi:hypothetical protein TGRUB_431970 [Toxoplasma gondii RUB]|uniref:Uncharacterized protein n=1 Tax=Toxoplasma gondii RUB TaxID=935652 RepID=A0A086LUX3_TOXGO|nr:hypothetical protein TGRUB_431970 [Toxoplasma gondii RUB]
MRVVRHGGVLPEALRTVGSPERPAVQQRQLHFLGAQGPAQLPLSSARRRSASPFFFGPFFLRTCSFQGQTKSRNLRRTTRLVSRYLSRLFSLPISAESSKLRRSLQGRCITSDRLLSLTSCLSRLVASLLYCPIRGRVSSCT